MFDIGFSELMLIGMVALVVIGPERLPKVARTVGHLLGRVQRYVSDVKSDIQREMDLDELKKLQTQVKDSARELESSFRGQVSDVESSIRRTTEQAGAELSALEKQVKGDPSAAAESSAGEGGAAGAKPQLELGLEASHAAAVRDKST
ncbi:MAG: twin-arginine translocase subunit TatB [Rhodocyclaceae bacterium]|nr:twin-arginine translocase subunit TatB [Rhodocyclaceae bacterium]